MNISLNVLHKLANIFIILILANPIAANNNKIKPSVPIEVTAETSDIWSVTTISTTDPFSWSYLDTMTAGDANNDGKAEIYLAGGADFHDAQIWSYQYSDSTWQGQNFVTTSGYNAIPGIVIGDANGDGVNELIYGAHRQGNAGPGPLYQRKWNGSSWIQTTIFGGSGDWTYPDGIGDLDQDTKNEVIASVSIDYHGNNAPWLFKYDSGSWTDQSLSSTTSYGNSHIAWLGDFDGDGNQELIRYKETAATGNYVNTTFTMVKKVGSSYQETDVAQLTSANFGLLGWQKAVASGDLDGDGRAELAFAYWRDDNGNGVKEANNDSIVIRVLDLSNGTWTSTDVASYPKPGTTGTQTLVIGDANNNGKNEIYTAGEDGVVRMITEDGETWSTSEILNTYNIPWRSALIADVNNDGKKDLVLEGRSLNGSSFMLVEIEGIGISPVNNFYIDDQLLVNYPCGPTNSLLDILSFPPLVDSKIYFRLTNPPTNVEKVYFLINGEPWATRSLSSIRDSSDPNLYIYPVFSLDGSSSVGKVLDLILDIIQDLLKVPGQFFITPSTLLEADSNAKLAWDITDIVLIDNNGVEYHNPGVYPQIRTIHDRMWVKVTEIGVDLKLRCDISAYQAYSPVNLLLVDSQGRRVGSTVDTIFTEIPNSFYSGPDESKEYIIIYSPERDSNWTLNVTGTDNGTYGLMNTFIDHTRNQPVGVLLNDVPTTLAKVDSYPVYIPPIMYYLPIISK